MKLLNKLVDVGINPVFIAHGKPRKYELPEEQGQFDRWECHKQFNGMAKPRVERDIDYIIPYGMEFDD